MNATTLAPARTNRPPQPAQERGPRSDSATGPRIEFDSSAIDTISMRTAEIHALASCVVCLTAVEKSEEGNFSGYELIDDALPLLGTVIMRLAREVGEAGNQAYAQYQEARDAANEVQQ